MLFLVRSFFFYTKGLPWTTQLKFHTSEILNRKCPLATTGSQDDGLSISEGVTLWGMIQNLFHQIRYNFITVYTPRAKSGFKIQNKTSIDIVVTGRLMKKMQICQTQVCRKTILISLTVFSVRISLVLKKNALKKKKIHYFQCPDFSPDLKMRQKLHDFLFVLVKFQEKLQKDTDE